MATLFFAGSSSEEQNVWTTVKASHTRAYLTYPPSSSPHISISRRKRGFDVVSGIQSEDCRSSRGENGAYHMKEIVQREESARKWCDTEEKSAANQVKVSTKCFCRDGRTIALLR